MIKPSFCNIIHCPNYISFDKAPYLIYRKRDGGYRCVNKKERDYEKVSSCFYITKNGRLRKSVFKIPSEYAIYREPIILISALLDSKKK